MRTLGSDLDASAWPPDRIVEALLAFWPEQAIAAPAPAVDVAAGQTTHRLLDHRVRAVARQLDLDAVAVETRVPDLPALLHAAGSALLLVRDEDVDRFLVVQGARRGRLRLLGPDGTMRKVALETVHRALCGRHELRLAQEVDELIRDTPLSARLERVRRSLLAEGLRQVRVDAGWLIHPSHAGPLTPQVRRAGLLGLLAAFVAMHAASYAVWLLAWYIVGGDALQGRLDAGWLVAGGLLLAMFAMLRIATDRLQMSLSIRIGRLLRLRLMEGALALDPRTSTGDGIGQYLGRIFEARAMEELAVSGGLAAATALLELLAALVLLLWVAGSWPMAGLLALTLASCLVLAVRHWRVREAWTGTRRALTHGLIEQMTGHRTRAVQEEPARRHEEEDRTLLGYLAASRQLDRTVIWLSTLVPRAWLLLASVGLGLAFSSDASNESLALMIGAILLAFESLRNLAQGLPGLAACSVAWQEISPLMAAAAVRPSSIAGIGFAPSPAPASGGAFRLEAQRLHHADGSRGRALLQDVSLQVRTHDRFLLEGPSGGGKSTLAKVLAGLGRLDRGLLLIDGMDPATLGQDAWRRTVALVAQFHENHIISETLAFNLLMGRAWPPTLQDVREAETICREVGLGDLLDRMPLGIDQIVGESGWQLSHGERSRLFVARALLQKAQLVIVDESLAALYPDSLRITLDCLRRRAPALLVIVHP